MEKKEKFSWLSERWKVEAVVFILFIIFMISVILIVQTFKKPNKDINSIDIEELVSLMKDYKDGEVVEINNTEDRETIANILDKQLNYMADRTIYIPFKNNSGVKEAEIRNKKGESIYISSWKQGDEVKITLKDGKSYSTNFDNTVRGESTTLVDQLRLLVKEMRNPNKYKVTATKQDGESPVWRFELTGWDEVLSIYNITDKAKDDLKYSLANQLGYFSIEKDKIDSLDVALDITLRLGENNSILCTTDIKAPNSDKSINVFNINEYYELDDEWHPVSKITTEDLDKCSNDWISDQIKLEYEAVDKMLEHFCKDHDLEYK